jgi:pimeloyl-ACP methyl ester carboxylesterase
VIAPDLRGYGLSAKPGAVADYRIEALIGDIDGLLSALGLKSALFAGHDWGALLLWQMALLQPQLIDGLICLNIPFFARGETEPVAVMRQKLGDDFYIVNFQDSDEADRLFDADPHHFINNMMRRGQISRAQFDRLPRKRKTISLIATMNRRQAVGASILTDRELKHYADAFKAGGFSGPINWYRNWTHNWAITKGIPQQVRAATLFIGAVDDVVVSPAQIQAMRAHVPDLEIRMIDDCGHWTQQEHPDRTNALMLEWMSRRYKA